MRKYILVIIIFIASFNVGAQDIQYSQFYANALYLSPSFAGSNLASRAIFHSRLQWMSLDASFVSNTLSFDHFFEKYNSGVGVLINSDYSNSYGANSFQSLEVGLQYSYTVNVNDKLTFRPGLQASFGNNSMGWRNLTFNQQHTDRGVDETLPTGENFQNTRFSYPDVGAGGLLYSNKWWLGVSAHHLNQPRYGFETNEQRLPMKLTIHTGTKILVGKQERPRYGIDDGTEYEKSISPVILYKMQGKWDQLDLGFYARYNNILGGFWYRGIPLKLYPNEKYNGDAAVFLLGFLYKGFTFAYSYDITLSQLTPARTGGSHEFSLTYNFSLLTTKKKKTPSKHKKPICPKI